MTIFKNIIQTKKQKARYMWAKMATSMVCGLAAFHYATPFIKPLLGANVLLGSGVLGVAAFLLAYVTIAPIIAFIFCLLEELAGL